MLILPPDEADDALAAAAATADAPAAKRPRTHREPTWNAALEAPRAAAPDAAAPAPPPARGSELAETFEEGLDAVVAAGGAVVPTDVE